MDQEYKKQYQPRRSYFGPILLITVGILFLGSNLGLLPDTGWGMVWKLWPLLLVVAGLDDLFRRNGIAWPILLIAAGVFLLYNNYGPQSWISWTQLFQLWPILLIAVGIDVLFRGQTGWMVALGVILTVALIGGGAWLFSSGIGIVGDYASLSEVLSSDLQSAEVELSLGMGELVLSDMVSPGMLIKGNITPDKKQADLEISGNSVHYQLRNNQPDFFPRTARWELGLTNELEVELAVNNGVGDVFLALEDLNLSGLAVNQAVGRLTVQLPGSSPAQLLVKQAIGLITIRVPEGARIAVDAKNGLSRVNFPEGFELEEGYYASRGAVMNAADLRIVVEQAIGFVEIEYIR